MVFLLRNGLNRFSIIILFSLVLILGMSMNPNIANGSYEQSKTLINLGLTSKPGTVKGLSATLANSSQIDLKWTAVNGATSYNIYRSEKSSGNYTLIDTSLTTSYSNMNVAENTTYYYKISAINSMGEGKKSSAVSAATKIPEKVAGLSVEVISETQLELKWRVVSGASSYEIFCSTSASGTYESIGTSTKLYYPIKGLKPNTTYYYKISAVNILGVGTKSSVVSGATMIPGKVVNLSVVVNGAKQLSLEWDAVSGAKSYKIYRSEKKSGSYKFIDSSDEPYYDNNGLKVNTTYYYKVSAVNKLGEGPKSSIGAAKTRK